MSENFIVNTSLWVGEPGRLMMHRSLRARKWVGFAFRSRARLEFRLRVTSTSRNKEGGLSCDGPPPSTPQQILS